MDITAENLLDFYATPLGQRAGEALGQRIRTWWPDLSGLRLMTSGYGLPLDAALMAGTPLSLAHVVPARLAAVTGSALFPQTGRALVTDDTLLPLDSDLIDRAILIHRLEHARRQDRTFREVWRVLRPGGRLIVVVPSAFGLWARMPANPFGRGKAFTGLTLAAVLNEQLFSLERMRNGLFFPPLSALKWARLPTGGVLIAEAQKFAGPAQLLQPGKAALNHRRSAAPVNKVLDQETRRRDHRGKPEEADRSR